MAETLVENKVCNACGADIRKDALFCYNCGGSVASDVATSKDDGTDDGNLILQRENIIENGKNVNQTKLKNKLENESVLVGEIAEKQLSKPDIQPESKLKSAAALRKKPKDIQKKKTEIIWEEHENAPNIWFISVAVVLMIFVAVILYLALYLK